MNTFLKMLDRCNGSRAKALAMLTEHKEWHNVTDALYKTPLLLILSSEKSEWSVLDSSCKPESAVGDYLLDRAALSLFISTFEDMAQSWHAQS